MINMGNTMLERYQNHNRFRQSLDEFIHSDPHLHRLSELTYQHHFSWWKQLALDLVPGIYILTGGRQVGKSTSCKQLIQHCLQKELFAPDKIFYLPCDEIYDAKALSDTLRLFLNEVSTEKFLIIIDEITYVKDWDRVIKALADEGYFQHGLCLLTGSDTLILKEAAMRFPGRRGTASKIDFHLHPLSFSEYVGLLSPNKVLNNNQLFLLFKNYLICGGYLRAINDLAQFGKITEATLLTYEQWVRGDFLKQHKKEDTLLAVLCALLTVGASQISYTGLTQKIGLISNDTCIDYCRLLERMDILINLQAFDQNKKQGFPRKARKFHFFDPFIYHMIHNWLQREGYLNSFELESTLVEACVASHCHRLNKTFYFKGQGEIDIIWRQDNAFQAIEVKWTQQLRLTDLKMLKQFKNSVLLTKTPQAGLVDNIPALPVYQFLHEIE